MQDGQKVLAIIGRNAAGVWERLPELETKEGDRFTCLRTARGFVLILGPFTTRDYEALQVLLDRIISESPIS